MKELDRIKQEVAIEFSAGNYESFEQAIKVYDSKRMINELCKRYAQLVAEASLKEAAENATASDGGMTATVDKSSITNHKNVKLI